MQKINSNPLIDIDHNANKKPVATRAFCLLGFRIEYSYFLISHMINDRMAESSRQVARGK